MSATVSGVTTTYSYDGDGILESKTTGGVTTQFLTDGGVLNGYPQVLAEVVNGSVVRSYAYGTSRISMTDVAAGKTYYFGTDGSGSTRVLMDENGAVTDTFDYAANGILLNHTGTTVCPFGFQGEYTDPDTGLVYLRARWMDPQTGRFMGMDSFEGDQEDPLSLHKYLFVKGDGGVNRSDPSGNYDLAEAGATMGVMDIMSSVAFVAFAIEAAKDLLDTPIRLNHYTNSGLANILRFSGILPISGRAYFTDGEYRSSAEAKRALVLTPLPERDYKITVTLFKRQDHLFGPVSIPGSPVNASEWTSPLPIFLTPIRLPVFTPLPLK